MLTSYINSKKSEHNLTNQQLSNLSGIPKGTIDRLLSKDDDSCNLSTAVALIKAIGGSLDEAMGIESSAPSLPPVEIDNTTENLIIVRDISKSWWTAVSAINRDKNAAYAESLKSRDHWLTFSVAVNCVFIAWLIYDLLHPTRGWIQYELSIKNLQQGLIGGWSLCSLWWSRLRL